MPLASHRIVLIASLIFDDDQVEWLRPRIVALRTRLVFESALELMAPTRLTRFEMGGPSSGMPEP
jgi:magnesium chelatase subunit H